MYEREKNCSSKNYDSHGRETYIKGRGNEYNTSFQTNARKKQPKDMDESANDVTEDNKIDSVSPSSSTTMKLISCYKRLKTG